MGPISELGGKHMDHLKCDTVYDNMIQHQQETNTVYTFPLSLTLVSWDYISKSNAYSFVSETTLGGGSQSK